jgi:hypothetical protein
MVKIVDLIQNGFLVQGLTAGHTFWMTAGPSAGLPDPTTRYAVVVGNDTGSAGVTVVGAAGAVEPPGGGGSGWWDLSQWDEVNIHYSSPLQTPSGSLTLQFVELWPNAQNSGTNTIQVAQSLLVPAIAISSTVYTSGVIYVGLGVTGTNSVPRRIQRLGIALAAASWPTSAMNLSVSIWGVRNAGQGGAR